MLTEFVRNIKAEGDFKTLHSTFKGKVKAGTCQCNSSNASKEKIICEVEGLDLGDIYAKIRQQIVNWLKLQTVTEIRELQENKHYEIKVDQSSTNRSGFLAVITCKLCSEKGTKLTLTVDKNTIKLSNWYKHVKLCIMKTNNNKKAKQEVSKGSLHNFFSSNIKHSKLNKSNGESGLHPVVKQHHVSLQSEPQLAVQVTEEQTNKNSNVTMQASEDCDQVF